MKAENHAAQQANGGIYPKSRELKISLPPGKVIWRQFKRYTRLLAFR